VPSVIVIGGGISGLTAAYYLHRACFEVTLIEKSRRLGGLLETRIVDGCRIEAGPDSFLAAKPAAMELIRDLGLVPEVIASNDHQRRTYILRDGRLLPMPDGLVLMAPTDLAALESSELISPAGRARAAEEFQRQPLASPLPDRSIGEFTRDHYGQEFVDYLAEPLLTGVFGGDADSLSLREVLPRFADLETRYGSVSRGLAAERSESSGPLFRALRGGFQQLVDALEGALTGVTRMHGEVVKVEPGARVLIKGEWLEADHAVLAIRAWEAAPLLAGAAPDLASMLAAIPYSSAVTVGFTYPSEGFPHPLDGFGFLVPKKERQHIVACTWVNKKFEHRAGPGRVLLRSFLGGEHWAASATDAEIADAVREDLDRIMGVGQTPVATSIARWPKSMPQYEVGHSSQVAKIRGALVSLRGIHLAGNYFDGVGIPDSIRTAKTICNVVERCYSPFNDPAMC
jgi:oxygen-dependent protoporphyrinogen oxidase